MSLALRASVVMPWLCVCEQAPTQALTSPLVASQQKTSSEAKTPRFALKKRATGDHLDYNEIPRRGFSVERSGTVFFPLGWLSFSMKQ